MKGLLAAVLALAALALPAAAISADSKRDAGGAEARYVFTFQKGLVKARIGARTAGYETLFQKAMRLPDLGQVCFSIRYAVSAGARQARKADLELLCGDHPQITEARLASGAFCSAAGTCIGSPGSLKKFAAELKSAATVKAGTECLDGRLACSTIEAVFGPIQVAVRSSNCRTFASVAAIKPTCVAGDVLIYRLD